ncbi:hypothetical protein JTB14_008822 [Gonioctena quinquepunctata]|nr:hypothetical protein JTB14_032289 [Gonioctena quinquepunctata]KAG5872773.1 hypothetical protein JTB14_008822 [Gonioctena quinquepunctata]
MGVGVKMTFFWLYAAWGFSTLIAHSRWTIKGHSWRKICWPFSACLRLGVWTALASDCLLLCFHVLELLKGPESKAGESLKGYLRLSIRGACLILQRSSRVSGWILEARRQA